MDANLYTFFNTIKERATLLEEVANFQAKDEAEAWQCQLIGKLKSAGLDDILTSLCDELTGKSWLTDRQQALAMELTLQVGNLKKQLLEEAKNAIQAEVAGEICAAAEKEHANLHKEEKEQVQWEVSCDVNQEVRNWQISYKEKREVEFQSALDTEVKTANVEGLI